MVHQGYGNEEKLIDLKYILEVKPKGFAGGLGDEMREMENTRMTSRFLLTASGRMIGSTRHWNGETGVGVGCQKQWNGEGSRVPDLFLPY